MLQSLLSASIVDFFSAAVCIVYYITHTQTHTSRFGFILFCHFIKAFIYILAVGERVSPRVVAGLPLSGSVTKNWYLKSEVSNLGMID